MLSIMARSVAHKAPSGSPLVPFLMFGSLLIGAALYANAQYPAFFLNIKYQLMGSSPTNGLVAGQNKEQLRIQQIDALLISQRNKIDLQQGRPFWGAASHMVELAFAREADEVTINRQGARIYEFHRYGFAGNREPIVMEFANNALTCAHYPQRRQTLCSPGARSLYDGQPFPFEYKISVTD
jgi:hypothetical protein